MSAPDPNLDALLAQARAGSREALGQALARLRDEYRQVLTLRYQERLGYEEIGQRLGRTANAARLLFTRAVARLRQEMGEQP
jgi:RNA polymerase sigma-70 factor (ECF subfamily)